MAIFLILWGKEKKTDGRTRIEILFYRQIRIISPYRERNKDKSELGKEEKKDET